MPIRDSLRTGLHRATDSFRSRRASPNPENQAPLSEYDQTEPQGFVANLESPPITIAVIGAGQRGKVCHHLNPQTTIFIVQHVHCPFPLEICLICSRQPPIVQSRRGGGASHQNSRIIFSGACNPSRMPLYFL